VSPADEGRAAREHAMSTPVGGGRGDGDGRSKYVVPRSAVKREGCATTGIGGTTHGDGDGEINSGAPESETESAVREHAMAASIVSANEDGDGRSSHGALGSAAEHEYCAMDTSPTSQWMADASFLRPRLVISKAPPLDDGLTGVERRAIGSEGHSNLVMAVVQLVVLLSSPPLLTSST
jgi:hypothetical protein